jgi:thiosulfate/3-mercaptopyruvate sulfurtransferase
MTLAPRPERVVDAAAVERLRGGEGALLIDARARERYRGEVEPVDARAGHIPGAKNAPHAGNLDASGRFLPEAALEQHYRDLGALGADPVIAYCGSGVTACHAILALARLGKPDVLLYEGSWSDWARDPARPIAIGDD